MVACALIPRLSLLASVSEREELLRRPLALAPEPGGRQVVGEVSGPAEAFGVRAGMRLGEALSRCPSLALAPPDVERASALWEGTLRRLEGIGAAVEPGRPGEAFFELDGLQGLWGGSVEGVLRRARAAIGSAARSVPTARLGAGPGRLCAYAAALRSRPRRAPLVVSPAEARAFLAGIEVGVLRGRLGEGWERLEIPEILERLGLRTLGDLAGLPEAAIADRFGEPGLQALRLARGIEEPLRPRTPATDLVEHLELSEAFLGSQLEQAMELLVDRLLASPARHDRSLRRVRISARLVDGGSWGAEAALREASADAERLRLALRPKLGELPSPAVSLSLRALETGPPAHDQGTLTSSPGEKRRERLAEAVRQARAVAGRDAVMRVLEVDSASRVPERRSLLTPFPEVGEEP